MAQDRRIFTADKCRQCLRSSQARAAYLAMIFLVSVLLLHPSFADRVLSVAERYSRVVASLIRVWR